MVKLRKEHAGSASTGHIWETDGAVVEVSHEDARALLAVPHAGFTVVEDVPEPTKAELAEQAKVAKALKAAEVAEAAAAAAA